MLPITICDLMASNAQKKETKVCGWIRHRRIGKNVGFLNISDGSTHSLLQVVFSPDDFGESIKKKMQVGASIEVFGDLIPSKGGKQGIELQAKRINILGESTPDYPLQAKKHGLAFLRTIQHFRSRSNTFGAIFRLRHLASYAIHDFFHRRQFLWVHTPIVTNIDTEGAGEIFSVSSQKGVRGSEHFFGSPAHLTVSGQLALEPMALSMGRVYTFGPTFRAENSNTLRHLSEFWMVEPEVAFASLADVVALAEDLIKHVIDFVAKKAPLEIDFLSKRALQEDPERLPLLEDFKSLTSTPFQQITYSRAIELLINESKAGKASFDFPIERWGDELKTEHERYLTAYFKGVVVVTDYPQKIKPFYMRQNEDGKTVAAMDILFPKIGEMVGGSAREERFDRLQGAMKVHGLDEEIMEWYLDTRRFGSVKHGGFGIGFERLMLYLTGMTNIRDVIPYPRTPGHIAY